MSRSRANCVLAALSLGTFVLGSAELLVVGLLDLVAVDLQVSVSAAGTLLTANALGLAFGGLVGLVIAVGAVPFAWATRTLTPPAGETTPESEPVPAGRASGLSS